MAPIAPEKSVFRPGRPVRCPRIARSATKRRGSSRSAARPVLYQCGLVRRRGGGERHRADVEDRVDGAAEVAGEEQPADVVGARGVGAEALQAEVVDKAVRR